MAIIQEMLTNNKETCTLAENIAYYILNTDKSKCRFCGGTMVRDDMVNSIAEVATTYGEKEEVKLRHFVISFSKNEQIDEVRAKAIGVKIIEIVGYAHQAFYAVHDNTDVLHVHLLINPISYLDGHYFCEKEKDYQHFIAFLAHLLFYDFRIRITETLDD